MRRSGRSDACAEVAWPGAWGRWSARGDLAVTLPRAYQDGECEHRQNQRGEHDERRGERAVLAEDIDEWGRDGAEAELQPSKQGRGRSGVFRPRCCPRLMVAGMITPIPHIVTNRAAHVSTRLSPRSATASTWASAPTPAMTTPPVEESVQADAPGQSGECGPDGEDAHRVDREDQRVERRRDAVEVFEDEAGAVDVGEHRRPGETQYQAVSEERVVGQQVPHRAERSHQTVGVASLSGQCFRDLRQDPEQK